jgi:hypothetical protein
LKSKRSIFALWLFMAACAFAFAPPPIYPGAKAVDELNNAAKKAGQDSMSYNTPDSFEKVYEFYRSKGTDVQRAHRDNAREKFALVNFPETGYGVAISWKASASSRGTVIHIGK